VDGRLFHSKWIPVAAVCLLLATIFGIPGVVMQFHPEYIAYWQNRLADVQSADARLTWRIIHTGASVLALLCPAVFTVAFVLVLAKRADKGLGLVSWVGQIMGYLIVGVSVLLQAVVAYRVIRYVLVCIRQDTGVYLIYAMLVTEGILLVGVWAAIRFLRRFLNSISDSADSMAVTFFCGKLDTAPTPALTSTGFLVLGIICVVFGVDRLVDLTVVQEVTRAYYAVVLGENPVLRLEGVSYLFSAAANFLIFGYVRRYKRIAERIVGEHRQKILRGEK
jgi:hypothetical protein